MTPAQAEEGAAAALRELCEGKSVYVMGASDRRRRDRDGSVRGSVFVGPELTYVNGELLSRGVARYSGVEDPYVREGLLQAYEAAGQAAQAGLWQGFKPLANALALPAKYRSDGRLMVPLRELVEWMDAKLTVEPNGRIICANPDVAVKAFAADLESEINGRGRVLDRPMEVRGDTMFVPVHMLACPAQGEARSLPHGEVYFRFKERWTLIP
ncbi:MAG: thermonuclease family protein [Armatimonadetes bacterium]|nr:thermonuclease family protein [Armatimonadota bacterium]